MIVASAGVASAQTPSALNDPWVPPALRKASPVAPARGESLREEVRRKLRTSFEAADTQHTGALTREQALRAGLGLVADNFERIDREGRGQVTFDDLIRYLRAQGADL